MTVLRDAGVAAPGRRQLAPQRGLERPGIGGVELEDLPVGRGGIADGQAPLLERREVPERAQARAHVLQLLALLAPARATAAPARPRGGAGPPSVRSAWTWSACSAIACSSRDVARSGSLSIPRGARPARTTGPARREGEEARSMRRPSSVAISPRPAPPGACPRRASTRVSRSATEIVVGGLGQRALVGARGARRRRPGEARRSRPRAPGAARARRRSVAWHGEALDRGAQLVGVAVILEHARRSPRAARGARGRARAPARATASPRAGGEGAGAAAGRGRATARPSRRSWGRCRCARGASVPPAPSARPPLRGGSRARARPRGRSPRRAPRAPAASRATGRPSRARRRPGSSARASSPPSSARRASSSRARAQEARVAEPRRRALEPEQGAPAVRIDLAGSARTRARRATGRPAALPRGARPSRGRPSLRSRSRACSAAWA